MDAKMLIDDMLFIWAQTHFELEKAQKLLENVRPTSVQACAIEVLKYIEIGNYHERTIEENIIARKQWVQQYSKPTAKGSFWFENWQVKAALMTESQMQKLARHAGVAL